MLSCTFLSGSVVLFSVLSAALPTNSYGGSKCHLETGHNIYRITIPYSVQKVESVIGVFQSVAWQNVPTTSTTGKPNAIGSKRDFNYAGVDLGEELSYTKVNPHYFEQKYFLYNGPVTGVLAGSQMTVDSYDEDLIVTPAYDGKSSLIQWSADYCSSNATFLGELFEEVHVAAIETVVELLG